MKTITINLKEKNMDINNKGNEVATSPINLATFCTQTQSQLKSL